VPHKCRGHRGALRGVSPEVRDPSEWSIGGPKPWGAKEFTVLDLDENESRHSLVRVDRQERGGPGAIQLRQSATDVEGRLDDVYAGAVNSRPPTAHRSARRRATFYTTGMEHSQTSALAPGGSGRRGGRYKLRHSRL
jgi:hypothetical protein